MADGPTLGVAAPSDAPALVKLIERSARALCIPDYTEEQVEKALGSAWGLDTQLIDDGTYYVARASADIVACGGWSYRETLFGADAFADRNARELEPGRDAARIRAFFVSPAWARKGLGRAILERCEEAAIERGFTKAELMATLPGVRLYQACGYRAQGQETFPLPGGGTIDFVPMVKIIGTNAEPSHC